MAFDKTKRALRIVFMGTPDFAVAGLKKLVHADYHIVGVVTAPDKPAGRGRKLHQSAIKVFAEKKGLHLLQPANLKSEAFLTELKALSPNLQIVVAIRMLPKVIWQIPEYGTFNLHASLLPQYRGAAPINWAIINGEKKTGVTTFFIDSKIDTGEIILQKETAIENDESAGVLHDKLMDLGADLILETVELIARKQVTAQKQPTNDVLLPAPKIFREDCKIDWSLPTEAIYNFVRGLSPYPSAWSTIKNGEEEIVFKLFQTEMEESKHLYETGTIVKSTGVLKVATKDGFLHLTEMQLSGKRRMTIKEVLNGLKLENEAHMR